MPTLAPTNGRGVQVVTLGEIVLIHDLKRQGLSVSAIARKLSLDRKTVRRHLERGMEPPVNARRATRPCYYCPDIGRSVSRSPSSPRVEPNS